MLVEPICHCLVLQVDTKPVGDEVAEGNAGHHQGRHNIVSSHRFSLDGTRALCVDKSVFDTCELKGPEIGILLTEPGWFDLLGVHLVEGLLLSLVCHFVGLVRVGQVMALQSLIVSVLNIFPIQHFRYSRLFSSFLPVLLLKACQFPASIDAKPLGLLVFVKWA